MKRYLLLRSNRESGPFTKAELKTYGLLSTDLIWIENESTAWVHPTEIEELKPIAAKGFQKDLPAATEIPSLMAPHVPSLQEYQQAVNSETNYPDDETALATYHYQSRKSRRRKSNATANSFAIGSRVFGALVLLIGIVLCGFVVVNMMNQFGLQRPTTSEAVEIKSEILPPSNTAHTAQAALKPSFSSQSAAIVKLPDSTARVKATTDKKPQKDLADTKKTTHTLKPDTSAENSLVKNENVPKDDATDQKPTDEKPEATTVVNRTPSLQLSANDYKVGLFGGISNLEIVVTNPSSQRVAKALIEIDYLKPNGSVVKTQTVTAENISPNASKTLTVPPNSRGVKVRYRVAEVDVQN